MQFVSGQYLIVGTQESIHRREYSIYSSPQDDYLEILLKEIPGGLVSGMLHHVAIGALLEIEGPFGYFTIPPEKQAIQHIMIATGTGIAPFHSFVRTYPELRYHIAHGTRTHHESYECDIYNSHYTACLSKASEGGYMGRVTHWLSEQSIKSDMYYWLCGNSDMIYEVHDILIASNVDPAHIMAEVYF